MIYFLKKNWLPILFAFLTGLIIVFPQIALVTELGKNYQGINIDKTDSENYYSARIKEAYDGYFKVANPEFYEYKNESYLQPALIEVLLAFLAKIFFLTPAQIILLGKFIFPALLFLAIYYFSFKLTQSKILSLTIPLVIIFASKIISFPQEIFLLFNGQIFDNTIFNNYSRPIHPQFSSLIFFIWLVCFYLWLKTKKKSLFWLSGILFGLMFYIYLYSWMLALAIMGVVFILSFFGKLRSHWERSSLQKNLLLIIFIGFLISIFYWLNFLSVLKNPNYEIAKIGYGFYQSHQPLFGKLLILDFIILGLFYLRRKKDLNFYFLLSLFLASLIVINQQVITGLRFYPGHWHWYYLIPFSILLVLWTSYQLLNKLNKRILYVFFITIISFSFIYGFLAQYSAYQNNKDTYFNYQRYGQVFKWLEKNTNKDDVVLTNKILRDRILVYTHCNNYSPSDFGLYLTPYQRLLDSFFVNLSLNQISSDDFYKYARENPYELYSVLPGYYNQRAYGCNLCYKPSELRNLKNNYEIFLTKDFKEELKKYRIDYVVWDTQVNKIWNLDQYNFMDFITEINGLRIYKVI